VGWWGGGAVYKSLTPIQTRWPARPCAGPGPCVSRPPPPDSPTDKRLPIL
jgi:hypothetical protein